MTMEKDTSAKQQVSISLDSEAAMYVKTAQEMIGGDQSEAIRLLIKMAAERELTIEQQRALYKRLDSTQEAASQLAQEVRRIGVNVNQAVYAINKTAMRNELTHNEVEALTSMQDVCASLLREIAITVHSWQLAHIDPDMFSDNVTRTS